MTVWSGCWKFLHGMQMISYGKIIQAKDEGERTRVELITDKAISHSLNLFSNQGEAVHAELRIDDGRHITTLQRKKIYATIRDISNFIGDSPEYLKVFLKYMFLEETGEEYFSFSNCSLEMAREFISYILDFALAWDVPLSESGLLRTDDIDKYLFSCLKYRKCCITGKPNADIHHVTGSRVGMGRSRVHINHAGLKLMALSREWHNRVHQEGEFEIFKKFKIYGIQVDSDTLKELGLKTEDIS